jgi:hypothetical protein
MNHNKDTAGTADTTSAQPDRRSAQVLRILGAFAVLAIGAIHADEYFRNHYRVIPVIGPMFLLNVISAAIIGVLLLAATPRVGPMISALLALSGIGLAGLSIVFLLISQHTRLFGFKETGYRPAIDAALGTEALAAVLLGSYLALTFDRTRSARGR